MRFAPASQSGQRRKAGSGNRVKAGRAEGDRRPDEELLAERGAGREWSGSVVAEALWKLPPSPFAEMDGPRRLRGAVTGRWELCERLVNGKVLLFLFPFPSCCGFPAWILVWSGVEISGGGRGLGPLRRRLCARASDSAVFVEWQRARARGIVAFILNHLVGSGKLLTFRG